MGEVVYRFFLAAFIVVATVFDHSPMKYALLSLALFEGITNLRAPLVLARVLGNTPAIIPPNPSPRLQFEAARAMRLLLAAVLSVVWFFFPESLWFVPWFMAFLLGTSMITGVCPSMMFLQWLGFR